LWMVETIIAGAIEAGCSAEQAVELYRSVWYYTVWEILVRANAARRRAEDERLIYRDALLASLDPVQFPQLAGLAERWPILVVRDTYARGLRALVDGMLPGARR